MKKVGDSDILAWKKLKMGDSEALGILYDLHLEDLYAYGIQKTQDKDYVMDCIHDLFVDLYKYRAKLAETDNVKYYLLKSLGRRIHKSYGKKTFPVAIDTILSRNPSFKGSTASCEEKIVQDENITERNLRLEEALNRLSKKQRKGIFLRFNQGRPYEEIAEIMSVSKETARTTVYRALKVLRKYPLFFPLILKITIF